MRQFFQKIHILEIKRRPAAHFTYRSSVFYAFLRIVFNKQRLKIRQRRSAQCAVHVPLVQLVVAAREIHVRRGSRTFIVQVRIWL
jgi:hypothetical protein